MSLILLPLALYGAWSIYNDPATAMKLAAKVWVWLSGVMTKWAAK